MVFDLLVSWLFGLFYVGCCMWCVFEGTVMLIKGDGLNEKAVGLLVVLLGILGFFILF